MTICTPPLLTANRLDDILQRIPSVRAGVIGDVCLDLYWHADMTRSVLSRETPHFPLPIMRETASPGGAGNVAHNIATLAKDGLTLLGVLGEDWRGGMLSSALAARGIAADSLLRAADRQTNTYIKSLRSGYSDVVYEAPRLDFENHTPLPEAIERQLIERLNALAPDLDVLCVGDQMAYGCITPAVREAIMALGREGLKVVVDSRANIGAFRHVIVKPNELEAAAALGQPTDGMALEQWADMAVQLSGQNGRPALITMGDRGCLAAEDGEALHIPSCPATGPIDICGAGDTFIAAFSLALAAGAAVHEAAMIGNIAASVSIRAIGVTGTADVRQIREAYAAWRLIYPVQQV